MHIQTFNSLPLWSAQKRTEMNDVISEWFEH